MRVSRVVMIVETVSPTPFALLRRAKHFQYRDDDKVLQRFSDYEDPAQALSDECRRVLKSISSANDSSTSKASTSLRDASWSRFEDLGFGGFSDNVEEDDILDGSALGKKRPQPNKGMRNAPQSKTDLGRPTTPSWADFLSSGFVDDNGGGSTLLLPPDKILPPINIRANSSQSHRRQLDGDTRLEPGELASINAFALDDTFWWVWITSLAGEETLARKAAFGRCALIETRINASTWLVMEEIIKGAAPEPEAGAYIAEKKSIFSFSRRGRLTRSKSNAKGALPKADPVGRSNMVSPMSKTSIAPDQHARIQAAAAALQQKHQQEEQNTSPRRARKDEDSAAKTSSVFTLQPVIMSEAAPAMKWANSYDKNAIRAKYLGDDFAGKGAAVRAASSTSINKIPSTEQGPPPPAKTSHPAARDESTAYSRSNPDLVAAINRGPDGQGPQPKPDRPVFADKPPAVPSKEATSGQAQGPTSPIERKPIAPAKENIPPPTDPNAFSSGPEYSEKPTSNGDAVPAGPPSPESAKHAHNKLKKKNQSGVKGLFGRRKEEKELPKPAPQTNTSVAATRAALEAKAAEPVPTSKASKRFSSLGRKKAPEPEAPVEKLRPAPVPEVHEHEEHPISPVVEHSRYDPSHESVSPIESSELSKAEREFRSFDQGPLEDVPAFVPDDSPSQSPIEEKTRHEPVHHESEAPARESPDDVSAVSAEYDDEPQISPNDRWAQIRKNAAERAAQRQSEEQSRQTDRTEDGETSGEESEFLQSHIVV